MPNPADKYFEPSNNSQGESKQPITIFQELRNLIRHDAIVTNNETEFDDEYIVKIFEHPTNSTRLDITAYNIYANRKLFIDDHVKVVITNELVYIVEPPLLSYLQLTEDWNVLNKLTGKQCQKFGTEVQDEIINIFIAVPFDSKVLTPGLVTEDIVTYLPLLRFSYPEESENYFDGIAYQVPFLLLGSTFMVQIEKTGGANGSAIAPASWTYKLTSFEGIELDNEMPQRKPRPVGTATFQTGGTAVGLAFYDSSGNIHLWDAGEIYNTASCGP